MILSTESKAAHTTIHIPGSSVIPSRTGTCFEARCGTPVLLLVETLDDGAEENQDLALDEVMHNQGK